MKHPGTRHKARRRAVDPLFEAEAKGVKATDLVTERRELVITDESVGQIHPYTARVIEGWLVTRIRSTQCCPRT